MTRIVGSDKFTNVGLKITADQAIEILPKDQEL
jgi:hypothetical protein